MNTRSPAEVFPPGEFIKDEMEARGWTQDELAQVMGRPRALVNRLLAGKKEITPETAHDLASAFGTGPELWMNLESVYRLSLAKRDPEVARRALVYGKAPVKEMVKRKWIRQTGNTTTLENELLHFFGIHSLTESPQLTYAARKSTTYYDAETSEQKAWVCRVRNLGRAVGASPFDDDTFAKGLVELRNYIGHEANIRRVPAFLARFGVRLVIVEHLSRLRMDGVTLWLSDHAPVIGISMRFDRIDYFWFTLLHELIHVKYRDAFSFDERLAGEDSQATQEKPECERRADFEAADFLVPQNELDSFVLRVSPLFYRSKIVQFANRIQVHPGIIVGQLQRRGALQYYQQRDLLVKVRDILAGNVLTDGWGLSPLSA